MSIKEPENGEPGVKYIAKPSQQLGRFLACNGSCLVNADGREAYFLPYWFEKMDDGRLELHSLGALPRWIRDSINTNRGVDERSDMMGELKSFLDYLLKEGYCDSDVYDDEPTAIDRYMENK